MVHSTIYICELNGEITLRNTPALPNQSCTRKTMSTHLPAVRVPAMPPVLTPPYSPRSWGDPQPTAQTLILGAQIPSQVQWQRDVARRQIVLSELQVAEQRLQELNAQYQEGQPERLGNEKNYQKYLDRVAQLQQAISLTEDNISALRRELGTMGTMGSAP